jgi:hypothetical protein
MSGRRVQTGQIWRSVETQETWLVTKVYSELFASYAVLRRVGAPDSAESGAVRVKVSQTPEGGVLAGFSQVDDLA